MTLQEVKELAVKGEGLQIEFKKKNQSNWRHLISRDTFGKIKIELFLICLAHMQRTITLLKRDFF